MRRLLIIVSLFSFALILGSKPQSTTFAATVINVTDNGDIVANDGECYFREAINLINGDIVPDCGVLGSSPYTINLPTGTHSMVIGNNTWEDNNLNGDYDILTTEDVIINGAGKDATIIRASWQTPSIPPVNSQAEWRVFHILSNANVTFANVTIANGAQMDSDPHNSGGIKSEGTGIITIQNSQIANNVTADGGAAIYAEEVIIVDSIFTENISGGTNSSGAVYANKVTILNSSFTDNKSLATVSASGAVIAQELTIDNAYFLNNRSQNLGGAIRYSSSSGSMSTASSISNTRFINNRAEDSGGAILATTNSADTLLIENCEFVGNDTNLVGGSGGSIDITGNATISNSSFELYTGNTRSRLGTAIYIPDNTAVLGTGVQIQNSTFTGGYQGEFILNQGLGTIIQNSDFREFSYYGIVNSDSGQLTIERSTFTQLGSPILNQNASTLMIVNSTFSENDLNTSNYLIQNDASSTMEIVNTTIADNILEAGEFGIYNEGNITVANTIVSNAIGANCDLTAGGTGVFTDDAGNLEYPTLSCGFSGVLNDGTNSPLLLPLGNNGGATQTMALDISSPAIDGTGTTCPIMTNGVDQRGAPRDSNCDMGAFETSNTVVLLSIDDAPYVTEGGVGSFTITIDPIIKADTDISFVSSDEIAIGGGTDYTITTASPITIPANTASTTINFTTNADGITESVEIFNIMLTNATNASALPLFTDNQGVGTIFDDTPNSRPYIFWSGVDPSTCIDVTWQSENVNVYGDIHSNLRIQIGDSTNLAIYGEGTYANNYNISGSTNIEWIPSSNNPQPGVIQPSIIETHNIDDYKPGTGAIWLSIPSDENFYKLNCSPGQYLDVEDFALGNEIKPGLYYSDCDILVRQNLSGNATFVAKGSVRFHGGNQTITPYINDLIAFSDENNNSCYIPSISIEGQYHDLNGIFYAPQGLIEFDGIDNTIRGMVVGDQVQVTGENYEFQFGQEYFPDIIASVTPIAIEQNEGDTGTTSYEYTIALSNGSPNPVTVTYSTNDDTATVASGDYVDNDGVLTFNPGASLSQTVTVEVNGDTLYEYDEDFTFTLNSATNAIVDPVYNTSIGTITNDEPPHEIVIDNSTVTEGESGSFTINLDPPVNADTQIEFTVTNVTATNSADYTVTTINPVTISANATSASLDFTTNDDSTIESSETFTITLTNATNSLVPIFIIDNEGTGYIFDNEEGTFDRPYVLWAGGEECFGTVRSNAFNLNVAGDVHSNSTIRLDGFANNFTGIGTYVDNYLDFGFQNTWGNIDGDPDATSLQGDPLASVINIEDYKPGGAIWNATPVNERIDMSVACSGSIFDHANVYDYIVGGVLPNGIYYSACSIAVGETFTGTATFIAEGDIQFYGANQVVDSYAGSILAASDFNFDSENICSGRVIRADGYEQTWSGLFYAPHGKITLEGWSNEINGSLIGHLITIEDDEHVINYENFYADVIQISPAVVSHPEGDLGSTVYQFDVTLSKVNSNIVTVDYSTNDGTATLVDGDYADNDGTLTFNPSDPLTQTITVDVNGDMQFEDDEDFIVTLNSSTNATISGVNDSSTGTIINDESIPDITIDDPVVTEGSGGSFTINISPVVDTATDISFTVTDASATGSGIDYTVNSISPVTIPANTASVTIDFTTVDDVLFEGTEYFVVDLTGATNTLVTPTISDSQGITTLNDTESTPNLVVTNTLDELTINGLCSLREAITVVNGGVVPDCGVLGTAPHTITIPAGMYTITIGNTWEDANLDGDFDITTTDEVIFAGADAATTIIQASTVAPAYQYEPINPGQADYRVFQIDLSTNVTFADVTIRHGSVLVSGDAGGGILGGALVTFNNAIVSYNVADEGGGGILADEVLIQDSIFSHNGSGIWGGSAIYAKATIINSTVAHNRTGEGVLGGALLTTEMHISDSLFDSNHADDRLAGAIYYDSSGLAVDTNSTIDNTIFQNNSAQTTGAVWIQTNSADTPVISNSTFIENECLVVGGAIFVFGNAILDSNIFADNTCVGGSAVAVASDDFPGTVLIQNSTFSGGLDNPVAVINSVGVTTTIRESTFSDIPGYGIYNEEDGVVIVENTTFTRVDQPIANGQNGNFTIINSTISQNNIGETWDNNYGIENEATLEIINSTIAGNILDGDEFTIYNTGDITLTNTIVANTNGTNCDLTAGGTGIFTDGGGNLEYPTTSCGFGGALNDGTHNPLLLPLADNGGLTETMALSPASPAIDGTGAVCPAEVGGVDQRGQPRSPLCDIGAYEFGTATPTNDALILFDPANSNTSYHFSVLNNPNMFDFTNTPPTNTTPQWVMGDWDGDGVKTPAIFSNGVFRYTNDIGPSSNWSSGFWLGNPPSLFGVVAGRFDSGFANDTGNDCIGWVDSNTNGAGDLRFSLKYWCDMTTTPQSIGGILSAHWLAAPLSDSQGFSGTHQWVYGDWDNDGLDEPAVRRGEYITRSTNAPSEGAALYGTGMAQRWAGTGGGIGPGGHGVNDGLFVAGDWDGNGVDTWGVVYDDDTFYYRDVFGFNPGPFEFASQTFTSSISAPRQVDSHHNASGGSSSPAPAFADELLLDNSIIDTSRNIEADLLVSKAGNYTIGEVGLVGDSIAWTITVSNTGSAPANAVQLTDNVPSELRVDDALADKGTIAVRGQTVIFSIESIGVGETAQFQVITTILQASNGGQFANTVQVILPEGDSNGGDANLVARGTIESVDNLPATGYSKKLSW